MLDSLPLIRIASSFRVSRIARSRCCVLAILALGACIGLTACTAPKPPPTTLPGTLSTPPATIDTSGRTHQVVFEAPSPGWLPNLDQVRRGFRTTNVFITLRRPNPLLSYAQVVTSMRIETGVPIDQPVYVFARVIEHDAPADSADPYLTAARGAQPQ